MIKKDKDILTQPCMNVYFKHFALFRNFNSIYLQIRYESNLERQINTGSEDIGWRVRRVLLQIYPRNS